MEKLCADPFWDHELTINTTSPDLTVCFQHTAMVMIPSLFVVIFAPFIIFKLGVDRRVALPWTPWLLVKLVLCAICALLQIITFFHWAHRAFYHKLEVVKIELVYPWFLIVSLMLLLGLMFACRQFGCVTSGVVYIGWFLFAMCGVIELRSRIGRLVHDPNPVDLLPSVCFIIYYAFVLIELFMNSFADRPSDYEDVGKTEFPNPELQSSFLNQITFWFFTRMAYDGWRRALERKDLWSLNDRDTSRHLLPKWKRRWGPALRKYFRNKRSAQAHYEVECKLKQEEHGGEEEVVIINGDTAGGGARKWAKKGEKEPGPKLPAKPSIIWALTKCTKHITVPAVLFKLVADVMMFLNPQILKKLIAFVEDGGAMWQGMGLAIALLLNSILYSLILHQYFHRVFRVGMNVKSILVSAVFNKSLRLSNGARKLYTVGEIVNLMSVDVQRFMDVATYINMLWSAPIQIGLSLYFLWGILGPSVLAGVAVMVLLGPINGVLAGKQRKYQADQMKAKDQRIKLMNELLNSMKVLKLYAWEPSFEKQITAIRARELAVIRKSSILSAALSFTWLCAPFLVSAASFTAFVLSDPENHILTPQVAFVSLALFNILRFPMTMLPMMITFLIQANVSNKRLKDYLTSDELDPHTVKRLKDRGETAINIENGCFAWEESVPYIRDINLQVRDGSLVAVVGQVGTGKSSLMSAILGEMNKLSGSVVISGSVSYVPQQAWIQNATLRDNITFGNNFDSKMYETVVDACALRSDFDMLPGGDTTEIGEKGINLSGGQKQRVSVARAVYQMSDIYLLDDPLSAVDSHVGKHIFEKVISKDGLLRNKTRVLVTHGLSYLKHADVIVVMINGAISEMGSYKELLKDQGAFAEFLNTYLLEQVSHQAVDDTQSATISEDVEDILCDMEKVDPTCRKRYQSYVSHLSNVSGDQSPSPSAASNPPFPGKAPPVSVQSSVASAASPTRPAFQRSISQYKDGTMNGQPGSNGDLSTARSVPKVDPAKSASKSKTPEISGVKLISEETAETGIVKWSVYKAYIQAIGVLACILFMLAFGASNGFYIGSSIWLADWSNEMTKIPKNADNATIRRFLDGQDLKMGIATRLGVYVALGLSQGLFILIGSLIMAIFMVVASSKLHFDLLHNVLRSPMVFFDVTPLGRIVNRFGKDIDVVDSTLPMTVRSWVNCVLSVVSTLAVIVIATPIFTVVIIPLSVMYYFIQRFYVSSSRQLKRLESISRSPIYSHFQEAVQGAASIRAYNVAQQFAAESQRKVDYNNMAYYPNVTSNRWLAVRLETIGNLVAFFASIFAVVYGSSISPGLVGLSISYAMSITQTLNWAVRMTSELETNIVAVERIKEYTETQTEANWIEDKRPPDSWPDTGNVKFDNYAVRYRSDLELVVKNITCDVKGGEKIGIVGRTGAGKSSLTMSLFRIIEAAEGRITIDGIDISSIGLHDLRSKLTIIPQDPVLFTGTFRLNLDPFEASSDPDLWKALELSHLKEFAASLPDKLEHYISEGGENLSVGQRQLVCLTRAVLRKSKVLVLDEATAAVDLETDDLIQQTIRKEFADSTILTIAHRLNTIMDSTRIMVLDRGLIAEFAPPQQLLADPSSKFYGMARDAGLV